MWNEIFVYREPRKQKLMIDQLMFFTIDRGEEI
jgi:hypothetical protein